MNHKFHVGQKVVALQDIQDISITRKISKGDIETVEHINHCKCSNSIAVKGLEFANGNSRNCLTCNSEYVHFVFINSSCFAPLQETTDEMVEETLSKIGIEIVEPFEIVDKIESNE